MTYERRECAPWGTCNEYVQIRAAAGERNDIVLRNLPTAIVVQDRGAPLSSASQDCEAVGPSEVRCPRALPLVDAGDGDDRVEIHTEEGAYAQGLISVSGGPGDDLLLGSAFGDFLDGGTGTDQLFGGEGDDGLTDGSPAADPGDVLDGGPGRDSAAYLERTTPVVLSLGDLSGSEDRLAGIESLFGGRGDDVLEGNAGPNTLGGVGGDDRLAGLEGDDVLSGGDGDDRLDGGDGADRLEAGAGADRLLGGTGDDTLTPIAFQGNARTFEEADRDDLDCGEGADLVDTTRRDDVVTESCDRIQPAGLEVLAPAGPVTRLRDPVLRLADTFCASPPCRLVVTLKMAGSGPRRRLAPPGTLLGRRVVRLRPDEHGRPAAVRLSGTGRRALRRYGKLPVLVTLGGDVRPRQRFTLLVRSAPD